MAPVHFRAGDEKKAENRDDQKRVCAAFLSGVSAFPPLRYFLHFLSWRALSASRGFPLTDIQPTRRKLCGRGEHPAGDSKFSGVEQRVGKHRPTVFSPPEAGISRDSGIFLSRSPPEVLPPADKDSVSCRACSGSTISPDHVSKKNMNILSRLIH